MLRSRVRTTNWKDVGRLRRPHAEWRLGRAAPFLARLMALPPGSVVFLNPDGTRCRADKKLGSLRRDWRAAGTD